MNTIDDMEKSFKDLQAYSDSQFRTINSLKKEIALLKEENANLRKSLESSVPNLTLQVTDLNPLGISNEQLICETQIAMIKDIALTRQLSSEEAKKLEVFHKILNNLRANKEEVPDVNVEALSVDELVNLAILPGGKNESAKESST